MSSASREPKGKLEETRARILDSALLLFRKRGFDQTTMREIAAGAGVAVGAAYYYFESKEALVMAFYERAQQELEPRLVEALARQKDFKHRLHAVLEVKFTYFGPNRSLLGALSAHTDPRHPLSPFSKQTQAIRDKDVRFLARALEGSNVRAPEQLKVYLPRILWIYQMGLLLFWVYDRSAGQTRTRQLVEKSLGIVVGLIRLANFPLLRPLRNRVVDLLDTIYGQQGLLEVAGIE